MISLTIRVLKLVKLHCVLKKIIHKRKVVPFLLPCGVDFQFTVHLLRPARRNSSDSCHLNMLRSIGDQLIADSRSCRCRSTATTTERHFHRFVMQLHVPITITCCEIDLERLPAACLSVCL